MNYYQPHQHMEEKWCADNINILDHLFNHGYTHIKLSQKRIIYICVNHPNALLEELIKYFIINENWHMCIKCNILYITERDGIRREYPYNVNTYDFALTEILLFLYYRTHP